MTETVSGMQIYVLGQPKPQDGWLVSDWGAGQTTIMDWSDDNVRVSQDGHIELVLDKAPQGSAKTWHGGEIQNATATTTGTWSWTAQAPDMAPGAVFGMFTYKSDWKNSPWTEFDFEFVGDDTTKVELNIHMIDAAGKHVTLADNRANKTIIDLGFDASEGMHTYDVSVTDTGATFFIDGKVVGDFTGADMPGGTWNLAPMNSYVDLWAAPSSMNGWTGRWVDPGRALVAKILSAEIRDGEFGSTFVSISDPVVDAPVDPVDSDIEDADQDVSDPDVEEEIEPVEPETDEEDHGKTEPVEPVEPVQPIEDVTNTVVIGPDTDPVNATVDWALSEGTTTLILQDKLHINGIGNSLDNTLIGSDGRNVLWGLAGNDFIDGATGQDILYGGSGSDTLVGGRGTDIMFGGMDEDTDTFVFNSYKESRPGGGHDIVHDFISGIDKLDFSNFDADSLTKGHQELHFAGSTPDAYSVWMVKDGGDILVRADVDGDAENDFEVLIKDVASLAIEDFIF